MNQTQKQALAPTEQKSTQLIAFEKTLGDSVQNRVHELETAGRLNLPANYSVGNALNSAWLKILATQDKDHNLALSVCTKESIANALFDMAILGLNPAKSQGYFIVYGKQLTWMTSYFGKCAAVKRLKGIENEPIATLIYKGDEIEIGHNELGEETVIGHKTTWQNKLDAQIVGVYATVIYKGIRRSALLTMQEVKESWTMSKTNREHATFTGEFVKRTAINRLTKMIINTSNDDDLLAETLVANEEKHYDFELKPETAAQAEIATEANKGEVVEIKVEEPAPEVQEAPKAEVKPTAAPF